MHSTNEWPAPKNRLLLGLAINAMLLAVGALAHFSYLGKVESWETQIERQYELIVFGTQMSSLYFAWAGLLPVLLIVNIHLLFKDILEREIPRLALKLQNILTATMFLGLFLIVIGNLFINPVWEEKFREAGYAECENRVLDFRKAVFNDVWVRNTAHCEDPKLQYILHEHFGDDGFELASQYLRVLEEQSAGQ